MAVMADWPLRVNLVEKEFWEPYDSASGPTKGGRGNISDWSSDSGWDEFQNLSTDSCREYLQDMIDAFLTKAEARKIQDEDLDYLCEHVTDVEMEEVRHALVDAFTWAWEEAYTPNDRDMERALEFSGGDLEIPNSWYHLLQERVRGPKDWSPRRTFSEKDLQEELASGVTYEHEKNHWDRFLVFDWHDGPVIRDLRRKFSNIPEEFDAKDFEMDLKQLAHDVVYAFGKALEKDFQDVDISTRVDVDPYWKSVLNDKSRKAGIQREILAAVEARRVEEAENAGD